MFTQVGSRLEYFVEEKPKADKILDARGWSCPWCILKAKSQLTIMEPGEVLEVLFTDPLMFADFPKVLDQSGHRLIEISEQPGFSRLYVSRGRKKENNKITGYQTGIDKNKTKRR